MIPSHGESAFTRAVGMVVRGPRRLAQELFCRLPALRFIQETAGTQTPITFDMWWTQQIRGVNIGPYWPVHPSSMVVNWRNVLAGVETSPGQMPGCYIQAIGKVTIGDYTQIGPGVSLISANHNNQDLRYHEPKDLTIGRYCWLGSGAAVLPGVTLGDFTVVGANATVTKSFPEGYCVVVGNPARVVRLIDRSTCIEHRSVFEYHGYIPRPEFEAFRKANLSV